MKDSKARLSGKQMEPTKHFVNFLPSLNYHGIFGGHLC